jgi:hypothetical protein
MSKTEGTNNVERPRQILNASMSLDSSESLNQSENRVRYLCVDRFSEREISRQLAAVCNLLLRALARDFGVQTPGTVTIVPSENQRGVKLRISGHD